MIYSRVTAVVLYSGLIESKTDHIFVIACDMPFINTKLSEYMVDLLQDEDVIIPFVDGHYQPLYAIYGK
ncbi:molybdenum cofactor guanylyltransferase [Alkaliphilus sp. B6464]|uniref:molybdenum cofactor guanylyltransferase n=1 Tax=Alkaliphilus sp. B6464 TaxID=2731219 RepID=UPI001BA59350|nr:NTP transferase domain-containing protein [Alkaliphilus sp. B6464]QUH20102.1 NTP transferase domain-containing protein [Alkaliphilus sp. B6464]